MLKIAKSVSVFIGETYLCRVTAGEAARRITAGEATPVRHKKVIYRLQVKRTVSPTGTRPPRADCRYRPKYTRRLQLETGHVTELKHIPDVDRWVFILSLTDCLPDRQPEYVVK